MHGKVTLSFDHTWWQFLFVCLGHQEYIPFLHHLFFCWETIFSFSYLLRVHHHHLTFYEMSIFLSIFLLFFLCRSLLASLHQCFFLFICGKRSVWERERKRKSLWVWILGRSAGNSNQKKTVAAVILLEIKATATIWLFAHSLFLLSLTIRFQVKITATLLLHFSIELQ